jgi:hypothetical protein
MRRPPGRPFRQTKFALCTRGWQKGADLARQFGFEYRNGFAAANKHQPPTKLAFSAATGGLKASPGSLGRNDEEKIDSVVTFTGSAFQAPAQAIPVLVFGDDAVSLEPVRAWDFDQNTPKIPIGGWCQGALLEVGKGRVAAFGEAAMFTAQLSGAQKRKFGMNDPEAAQNAQFLLNVMHWLARTD